MSEGTEAQRRKEKAPMIGLWGVAIKLGMKFFGKAIPVLLKVFKSGKVIGFGLSAAVYAVIFSWPFAIMIMTFLVIHEGAHVLAMKQKGMKVRGMYFIPMMGAVAVSEEEFPSRYVESYVALAGPFAGAALAYAALSAFQISHLPVLAAAATWMALINLFNLFPINPLDGGRTIKSIAFSINSHLGFFILWAGLILAFILAFKLRLLLLMIVVIMGWMEIVMEKKRAQRLQRRIESDQDRIEALPIVLQARGQLDEFGVSSMIPALSECLECSKGLDCPVALGSCPALEALGNIPSEINGLLKGYMRFRHTISILLAQEKVENVEQLDDEQLSQTATDILQRRIEADKRLIEKPKMNLRQLVGTGSVYAGLAIFLLWIMFQAISVPGAKEAMEILK